MSDDPIAGVTLREALSRLDSLLAQVGVAGDIFVFGGAALVLGYDARDSTRDIDAIWRPHGTLLRHAWTVAAELGLPRSWLNDQATSYLPSGFVETGRTVFDGAALRVTVAEPELLLAMKVRAGRRGDERDILFLAEKLAIDTSGAVIALAERVLGAPIPARQRAVVEDLLPQRP